MAITSETKRRSVQGYTGSVILPVSDGVVEIYDRQHLVGLYSITVGFDSIATVASLTLTGGQPTVIATSEYIPQSGVLLVTGGQPTVVIDFDAAAVVAPLSAIGKRPVVNAGIVSDITALVGALSATGGQPNVVAGASFDAFPETGALLVTGGQPTVLTADLQGVLANDTDADLDPLTAILETQPSPSEGSVALYTNGAFEFTPATGFVGVTTWTYKANDGQDNSPTAVVTITVEGAFDNVATVGSLSVTGNTPGLIAGSNFTSAASVAQLQAIGGQPAIVLGFNSQASAGVVFLVTNQPDLIINFDSAVLSAALSATGGQPAGVFGGAFDAPAISAALSVTGNQPIVGTGFNEAVQTAVLVVQTPLPPVLNVGVTFNEQAQSAALILSGGTPVYVTDVLFNSAVTVGALTVTGNRPLVDTGGPFVAGITESFTIPAGGNTFTILADTSTKLAPETHLVDPDEKKTFLFDFTQDVGSVSDLIIGGLEITITPSAGVTISGESVAEVAGKELAGFIVEGCTDGVMYTVDVMVADNSATSQKLAGSGRFYCSAEKIAPEIRIKTTSENKFFNFDFTGDVGSQTLTDTANLTVTEEGSSDLSISNLNITHPYAQAILGGGTPGTTYTIKVTAEDNSSPAQKYIGRGKIRVE